MMDPTTIEYQEVTEGVFHYRRTAQEVIQHCQVREDGKFDESRCWGDSSMRDDDRDGWSGSASLGAAIGLLRNGWAEGINKIQAGADALAGGKEARADYPGPVYDVAGGLPDVGLYCAGEPAHMLDPTPTEDQYQRVVRIYSPLAASADVSARHLLNWGVALLSVINATESTGVEVEVIAYMTSASGSRSATSDFMVKNAGEPIDLARLAFMVAHPSMLRRVTFAAIETQPELRFLCGGYGRPSDRPQVLVDRDPQAVYLPRLKSGAARSPHRALEYIQAAIGGDAQEAA